VTRVTGRAQGDADTLLAQTLTETLDDLGGERTGTAGGTAAALTAAFAAALVAAVARGAVDGGEGAGGAAAQAEKLRSRLISLGAADAEIYARASALLESRGDTGAAGQADRDTALAAALSEAALVPAGIAEGAADVAALAALTAREAGTAQAADAAVAATLAEAAAGGAAHLVRINLGVRAGDEICARADAAAATAAAGRATALD
jgi:formiminotetrahydrofolate cyclodeaminase